MTKTDIPFILFLVAVVAIMLIGIVHQGPTNANRFIDHDAGVACWFYNQNGISCLPLSQTTLPQAEEVPLCRPQN